MNASGRPNTCKPNGKFDSNIEPRSGVRVRNTYAICPQQEDSSPKGELTSIKITRGHLRVIKPKGVVDEHAVD